jgi:2,3-bisphosphoglycerate-dependent phosphoglycerate mutase
MDGFMRAERRQWLESLDARPSGAAVLLEDVEGRALIVKANYKTYWALPGGMVDTEESPLVAALREVKDEVGIVINPSDVSLMGVAQRMGDGFITYQFIFTASIKELQVKAISPHDPEIGEWRFISKQEVLKGELPLPWSLKAWAHDQSGYFETAIADDDNADTETIVFSTTGGDESSSSDTPVRKGASGRLFITRHGESEWNLQGKWTGLTDVGLTEKGISDTVRLGQLLKDTTFDVAYTSALKRTHQTLDALLKGAEITTLPTIHAAELNERDYGTLTGSDKWEVKDQIGEEAFNGIRRGWDYPVPDGETLKDVYARVVPYFETEILPRLQDGENVLLVAHGNSIRALVKYLDQIPDDKVADLEMPFGKILVYSFDHDHALPVDKAERSVDISPTKA